MENIFIFSCLDEEYSTLLNTSRQSQFQSGFVSLFYIIKNSLLDINNSVRDNSEIIYRYDQDFYKLLLNIFNFFNNNRNLWIIFKEYNTLTWELYFYWGSDFTGDTSNRKIDLWIFNLCRPETLLMVIKKQYSIKIFKKNTNEYLFHTWSRRLYLSRKFPICDNRVQDSNKSKF